MAISRRFDGFISYSHKVDSHIAHALHKGLRRFGRPWYKLSSARIFRDETNLTATPNIWGDVKNALDASEYLILMASPAATQSTWVPRELVYWLTGGKHEEPDRLTHESFVRERAEHLLIVVSDGSIVWDRKSQDFDWARTDALPHLLSGVLLDEPLWIDLRWARDYSQNELGRRNARFNEALAKLLSPIRGGKEYLVLLDEDYWAHRRNLITAVAGACALALATGLAGWFGWQADARARDLEVRLLLSQSREVLDENRPLAQLLAVEASRRIDDLGTRSGLHESLAGAVSAPIVRAGSEVTLGEVFHVGVTDAGLDVLETSNVGVHLFRIGDEIAQRLLLKQDDVDSAVLLADGRTVVIAVNSLGQDDGWDSKLTRFDWTTTAAPETIHASSQRLSSLVQVPGCDCVGFINGNRIETLSVATLAVSERYRTDSEIQSLAAPSVGHDLFFAEDGNVYRLDLRASPSVERLYSHPDVQGVVASSNGRTIASWAGIDGEFLVTAFARDRPESLPRTLSGSRRRIVDVQISADERQVMVLTDQLRVWDLAKPGAWTCDWHGHQGDWDIEPSSLLQIGASQLVVTSLLNEVRLWELPCLNAGHANSLFARPDLSLGTQKGDANDSSLTRLLRDIHEPWVMPSRLRGTVTSLRFSPKGGWLAAADDSGNVSIWAYGDEQRLVLDHNMAAYAAEKKPDGPFDETGFPTPLAWSDDGRTVAWYDHSYRLLLAFNLDRAEILHPIRFQSDEGLVEDLRFLPDGSQLALVGYSLGLVLIDLNDPTTRLTASIDKENTSPMLVPGSDRNVIGVIDTLSGKLEYFRIFDRLERIDTPKAEPATRWNAKAMELWGERGMVWRVPGIGQLFSDKRFAGNDNGLAFAAEDRVVVLDSRGRIVDRFESAGTTPTAIALDPTGKLLAAGFVVGAMRLHNLDSQLLQRKACAMAGRQLDDDELRRYLPHDAQRQTCPDLLTLSVVEPPTPGRRE